MVLRWCILGLIKRLNERLEKHLKHLRVSEHGYVVDKRITRIAFVLCILLLAVVLIQNGTGNYFVCESERCHNPFYDSSCHITGVSCEPEFVSEGWSVGTPPNWLAKNYLMLMTVILGFAVFLNHFLNNRGVKVKEQ